MHVDQSFPKGGLDVYFVFFNNKSEVTSTLPLPSSSEFAKSTTLSQIKADDIHRIEIGEADMARV